MSSQLRAKIEYPQKLIELAQNLVGQQILVTGAQGFIGSHLMNLLSAAKVPCRGITSGKTTSSVRLTTLAKKNIQKNSLTTAQEVRSALKSCTAVVHASTYGAYSWQNDPLAIFAQVQQMQNLLEGCLEVGIQAFVHLGSSSEYGDKCHLAKEDQNNTANSLYSLAKQQCTELASYYGKKHQLPILNLRLFSVYGPLEHPQRLIPQVISSLIQSSTLRLSEPETSRDFVYILDVLEIILKSLLDISPQDFGETYNVCSGKSTSLAELSKLLNSEFNHSRIEWDSKLRRDWDLQHWSGSNEKCLRRFSWQPTTRLPQGLQQTLEFYQQQPNFLVERAYQQSLVISIVVPCYRDFDNIQLLATRLQTVFQNRPEDFELVVIDDCDTEDSFDRLKSFAENDSRWILARLSRNSGSQAVFYQGLRLATGQAIVFMDSDLQDPPEVIPDLLQAWKNGAKLCLGQRTTRIDSPFLNFFSRSFYRIWNALSKFDVPLDCGDFGLIDRSVADQVLSHRSGKKLWRTHRAFLGIKPVLIPYARPQRAFGRSSNNRMALIRWAFRFLFSTPNRIGMSYSIGAAMGFLCFGQSLIFFGIWLCLGIGLLLQLGSLIYQNQLSLPEAGLEKMVRSQNLILNPREDHAHDPR